MSSYTHYYYNSCCIIISNSYLECIQLMKGLHTIESIHARVHVFTCKVYCRVHVFTCKVYCRVHVFTCKVYVLSMYLHARVHVFTCKVYCKVQSMNMLQRPVCLCIHKVYTYDHLPHKICHPQSSTDYIICVG